MKFLILKWGLVLAFALYGLYLLYIAYKVICYQTKEIVRLMKLLRSETDE